MIKAPVVRMIWLVVELVVRSIEAKPPGALSSQSLMLRGPPKRPPLIAVASIRTYWVFSLRPVSLTLKRI